MDTSSSSLSSSSLGRHHLKHNTSLASSTSSIGPPSASYALALYSYTADNSDELTFHKGSVIAILSKEDSDWWKGDLNGQIGLVPANYVQELHDLQSSITSTRCEHSTFVYSVVYCSMCWYLYNSVYVLVSEVLAISACDYCDKMAYVLVFIQQCVCVS